MTTPFEVYIKRIQDDMRRGNATEYTYRSSLEFFIESFGTGIQASNDPKHIECGAPDFIVEKRKVPLGYIETKDIGADLDRIEKSDQMKRYLKPLHNLILTDYLEFRWYVNGQKRQTIRLATVDKNNRLVANPNSEQIAEQLFRDFFQTEAPTVNTPKELAIRLAEVTHFIKDQITAALEKGDVGIKKALEGQYKVFVDLLLPELTPAEFADLYAQTITYGLFAAKMGADEGQSFTLEDAYKYLKRIPFLRRLFLEVNEQLDEIDIIRPYLQDIVSLLNRSHMNEILADFGHRTRTEDPVVHFYETFLATYDPKMRESRGVYYTPEPVVQFIVKSVDEILKTRFNKSWGLADESVKVLDPATGTGTFLYYVIQKIHDEIVNVRGQGGQWQEKSKAALKRIYGFELLIAPYVISHLKLGLLMDSLGAPLEGKEDRMHVYLTNTLEEGIERAEMLAGLGSNIAEESSEAAKVKKMDDIMVVLGNPPYAKLSSNRGPFINGLMSLYKKALKGERNIQPLYDDYIKFIRFAQDRIERTGKGIVGLITNHSYLVGLIHRGMREELLKTFNEIYILNLHGNSYLGEVTPEGLPDKNIFDIKQGVSISIFIKTNSKVEVDNPRVAYLDLWGSREEKYEALSHSSIGSLRWNKIQPEIPGFFFSPKTDLTNNDYLNWIKITDVFTLSSSGVKTHRDHFVIDFDKNELLERIHEFRDPNIPDELLRKKFSLSDTRDWKLHDRRSNFFEIENWRNFVTQYLYHPFDTRQIYYHPDIVELPRSKVMNQIKVRGNFGLIANRSTSIDVPFTHIFVSDFITDVRMFPDFGGAPYIFPLYTYYQSDLIEGSLFSQLDYSRKSNLSTKSIEAFCSKLKAHFVPEGKGNCDTSFGPEDVFHYIYSLLHSPNYRKSYAEFLKIDFPRIPITSNKKIFKKLVIVGEELVSLHLLKSPMVEEFITTYSVSGNNKVEKVIYTDSKVMINPHQYFGSVPEDVWNFKIGGYQVSEKWLKDRKGRILTSEDISHYQRVVVALNETIRLMKEIDEVIPGFPLV